MWNIVVAVGLVITLITAAKEFNYRVASDNYFRVMEVPLLQGRHFTPQDNAKAPNIIIVNHGQIIAETVVTPFPFFIFISFSKS